MLLNENYHYEFNDVRIFVNPSPIIFDRLIANNETVRVALGFDDDLHVWAGDVIHYQLAQEFGEIQETGFEIIKRGEKFLVFQLEDYFSEEAVMQLLNNYYFKRIMKDKEYEVTDSAKAFSESASAGSTSSGAIASMTGLMGNVARRPSIFGYLGKKRIKKKKKK